MDGVTRQKKSEAHATHFQKMKETGRQRGGTEDSKISSRGNLHRPHTFRMNLKKKTG